jgi:hypothetical protein
MRYDVECTEQELLPRANPGSALLRGADKRRGADFLFNCPNIGPKSVDTAGREVQLSRGEGICVQWL